MLDLIRKVVSEALRTGQPDDAVYFEYCKAVELVPYYFGPEIEEYLEKVRHLIIELQLDASIIADPRNPDRNERSKGHAQRMNDLSDFYKTSKKLFSSIHSSSTEGRSLGRRCDRMIAGFPLGPLFRKGSQPNQRPGTQTATSSFVNAACVCLLKDFSFGDIKKQMRFVDSTRQINQMIRTRPERTALQPA